MRPKLPESWEFDDGDDGNDLDDGDDDDLDDGTAELPRFSSFGADGRQV